MLDHSQIIMLRCLTEYESCSWVWILEYERYIKYLKLHWLFCLVVSFIEHLIYQFTLCREWLNLSYADISCFLCRKPILCLDRIHHCVANARGANYSCIKKVVDLRHFLRARFNNSRYHRYIDRMDSIGFDTFKDDASNLQQRLKICFGFWFEIFLYWLEKLKVL